MKIKGKGILFVALLAVAGLFGASTAVINKQIEETAVTQKAEAKTTSSAPGMNFYLKDWSGKKMTSSGHDACLHLYDITWNSAAGYTTTGEWLTSGYSFDGSWWNYENQSDFYLKMNWVNDNREYQVKIPWFIQSCTYNVFIQDGVDKYLRFQGNSQSYSNTLTLGYDYTLTIQDDGYNSWWNGDIYRAGKISHSGSYADRKYNQTSCTVTINSHGGSAIANQTVWLGKKVEYIPIPLYSGHTFLNYAFTNSSTADPATVISDDCTLHAIWGDQKYLYWKPSMDEGRVNPSTGKSWFDDWQYIYYAAGQYKVGDYPGTTGTKLTINGETYYRVELTFIPTLAIVNNGNDGDGNKTPDISVSTGNIDGSKFLNVGASKTDSSYTNEWRSWTITITWKNWNDTTLETDSNVNYESTPSYNGSNPTRSQTAQYTYTWVGWTSSSGTEYGKTGLPAVTGNETYTARFSSTVRTYTVTFVRNNDSYGTISRTSITNVPYGTTVTVSSNMVTISGTSVTATAADDSNGYHYAFSNWTGAPATISGAVTITANFTRTSGETAAINYAKSFNTTVGGVCAGYNTNTKANFIAIWNTDGTKDRMEYNYSQLPDYVKYWLAESTKSSDSNVTAMLAKYDYVLGKYGHGTGSDNLHDYLSRTPAPKAAIHPFSPFSLIAGDEENNASTIIIIIASSVSLISITALSVLLVKKRKRKEQ